jgi:hypothetical protein
VLFIGDLEGMCDKHEVSSFLMDRFIGSLYQNVRSYINK